VSLTTQSEIVRLDETFGSNLMTESPAEKAHSTWEHRCITALAIVLVVAQCLAVAHYHPKQTTSIHSSTGANLDDGGFCALCLFHQHSPGASSATPFLLSSVSVGQIDLYAAESWPLYTFNSYLAGRSPPVTA
jgi:hypothetical protein